MNKLPLLLAWLLSGIVQFTAQAAEKGEVEPDFTVVVIPDSEMLTLADAHLPYLKAHLQWAASHKIAENIKAVVSVGDLTQNGLAAQFERSKAAYDIAKNAGLPVVPILGNHDYDNDSPASRSTKLFNTYYGPSYFSGQSHYGASSYPSGTNDNYFITFENGNRTYLILALEFYPRPQSVAWAQGVIAENPTAFIILATHAYLTPEGPRATDGHMHGPKTYGLPSEDHNGTEIYNALVKPYSNVHVVLNGHFITGVITRHTATMSSITGSFTNEIFVNYQNEAVSNRYIMIMRFSPSRGLIAVSYYSPTLAREDPEQPTIQLSYLPIELLRSPTVLNELIAGGDLRVNGWISRGTGNPGGLELLGQVRIEAAQSKASIVKGEIKQIVDGSAADSTARFDALADPHLASEILAAEGHARQLSDHTAYARRGMVSIGTSAAALTNDSAALAFGTSNFSIGMWVRLADWTPIRQTALASKYVTDGTPGWLISVTSAGALQVDLFNGSGLTAFQSTTPTGLLDGTWAFLLVTIDRSGAMQWYVNGHALGRPVSIAPLSSHTLSNTGRLCWFSYRDGLTPTAGALGETWIVAGIVTAAQAKQIARAGSIESMAASFRFYQWLDFGESLSGAVYDRSANQQHGRLGASGIFHLEPIERSR